MMHFRINSADVTSNVTAETFRKVDQLQQRTDSCTFNMHNGTKPTENQDLKIYDGATIASAAGATMTLNADYQADVSVFYAGQELYIRIGDADEEKVTVSTYTESTNTLVLTAAPSGTVSADDKIGALIFGGVVARVTDRNLHSLVNLEWTVTGVDYTKIFDKKLISDTWADVDSRYVINSFVNSDVNYNSTLDTIDYADNTAIQAEFTESSDGGNPTIDSADYLEGDSSGVFTWTFSGGTAIWAWTPTSKDVSDLTGVSSGTPTAGQLMLWVKTSAYSSITSLKVRIGSDTTNYAEVTLTLRNTTDWQYVFTNLDDTAKVAITGTPVWTGLDTAQIRIAQTASGTVRLNGLRVNDDGSFTLVNVEATEEFDDLRSPQLKPTILINQLAKSFEYLWYIDYERDIHFTDKETYLSPYNLTTSSTNFHDLKVEADVSNIGNRIIVRGGEKTSTSTYAEVHEGNNAKREWILKTKFNNLAITTDNNTSTDTMEAGTTTTTINATTHGLVVGDHIINRSRSNAVREVLTVPTADQFTVEAVTSQASGDTFSKFATTATDGVEGLTDETTVNYVANSNEKSVRAVDATATLPAATFIRFAYNERVPIQLQYTDGASSTALKALGLGDGIFDLDPITDRNIQDIQTALLIAQAKVNEFANAIVTGSFRTNQKGLRSGQIIQITDTTRSIDTTYLIQQVNVSQTGGAFHDYLEYDVKFGTTLFGWIEFMQKLLRTKDRIELNVDDIIETFATSAEDITTNDTNQVAKDGGFKYAKVTEDITLNDTNQVVDFTPPWKFEPSVGQTLTTRFNLSSFTA